MTTDLKSILRLEVPVIVQIASRTMKVGEVSKLTPGAIVELPKLADEDLEMLISNRLIGSGTAVKVGENFGIRITSVGNQRQRIEAMGAESPPEAAGESDAESACENEAENTASGEGDAAGENDDARNGEQ